MSFSTAQIERIHDLIVGVGRQEIMPRFHAQVPAFQKTSAFDVFTEADERAEQEITAGLAALFPDALLVGEEATGSDLSRIAALADAEIAFLIDPIDGTKNFTSGLPLFGTMVAGLRRGEIVFAAIHDPVCRDTAMAVRGQGARLRKADGSESVMGVAPPCPVEKMNIVAGTNFLPADLLPAVQRNMAKFGMNFWMRCAAHEYRMTAGGHCELLAYNKLMPWDHAAGWLLHREAGGHSAHFDGTPYRPTQLTGGLMCAPDRDSWQAARDCLFGE